MRAGIGLLTDFGTGGSYVASMKGILLDTCGDVDCTIVDITHDVPPQGIVDAALILDACCHHFPRGFIFVVVVDPGVGSTRRVLCGRTASLDQVFIGPDNGVLAPAFAKQGIAELVSVENPAWWRPAVAATFHGRDVMAPVAAHVARGVPLHELGPAVDPAGIARLPPPPPVEVDPEGTVTGSVLSIDSFGNVATTITPLDLDAAGIHPRDVLDVTAGAGSASAAVMTCTFETHFAAVPEGEPVCIVNSNGMFEIAVNKGRAASLLHGATPGTRIVVSRRA